MAVKRDLRRIAMDQVLVFEPGEGQGLAQTGEEKSVLDSLTPAEREKVLTLAARRLAFQVMFELDSRRASDASEAGAILARVEGLEPAQADHLLALVKGAYESRAESDGVFEAIAPEWPAHRQAAVDRAILRLAYFEMARTDTHPRIVINEAVELAKAYSSERAPAFINGLLDKAMRNLPGASRADEPPPEDLAPLDEAAAAPDDNP